MLDGTAWSTNTRNKIEREVTRRKGFRFTPRDQPSGRAAVTLVTPTGSKGAAGGGGHTDIPTHLPFIRDWLGFPENATGYGGMTFYNSN